MTPPEPVDNRSREIQLPSVEGNQSSAANLNEVNSTEDNLNEGNPSVVLPPAVVGRLGLYYRELYRLLESGVSRVNSGELGKLLAVSPEVVRRDLHALGAKGRRGVGYGVASLIETISNVLGSETYWRVILVGVGSLGDALLRYKGFDRLGFRLVAAVDTSPKRIGTVMGGITVSDAAQLESVVTTTQPALAILAVPSDQAHDVAVRLIAAGVTGILNFAPITLQLIGNTAVVNVDLASELQRLAFAVQQQK